MNRNRKLVMSSIGLCLLAVLVVGALYGVKHTNAQVASEEAPAHPKSKADHGDERFPAQTVRLTKDELENSGLQVATVQPTTGRPESEVLVAVLPVQELLDLTTAFRTAQLQVERAQVSEHASRLEYERLRQLNLDDKNVSDKAVQAAEATFRTDTAMLRNTEQTLDLAQATNLQHWGPVVSRWISSDAQALRDVLGGRQVLLQVTFPDRAKASRTILIPVGKRTTEARLLSPATHVDPKFQRPSFLYEAEALTELVPGMNLSAFAAQGSNVAGFLLPREAVLHWQGKTWVYIEEAPSTFIRKEVTLDTPMPTGWLILRDLSKGDRIVITGAQQLLSQEFRAQTAASDGDKD